MFQVKTELRSYAILSILAISLGMSACSSDDDTDDGGGILGVVPDVDVPDVDVPDVDVPDVDVPDVDVPGGTGAPVASAPAGSFDITFRNTSETQPMTAPVVILHTAGAVEFFLVTQPAAGFISAIAEDGNPAPLNDVIAGQVVSGTIGPNSFGEALPESGPPLIMPGASTSITLEAVDDNQSLSFVSMVLCTNDGFTGVNARPLVEETFMPPIYDAGSESNVLTLDYFVPPCNGGSSPNISDEENGAIAPHPGQSGAENPDHDFTPETAAAGLLEVTVTAN